MDSFAFWINPVILVGIGTMLWRSQVRRFDQIDSRFDRIDKRFDRIDMRFERIDKRFDRIDRRFERIDGQFHDVAGQLRDLNHEVAANGKSIARIEGRSVSARPVTVTQRFPSRSGATRRAV